MKYKAWDIIGASFFSKGRESAKPSNRDITFFLSPFSPGDRVAIIGASTEGLIRKAIEKKLEVFVFDFSKVMCDSLREKYKSKEISVRKLDIVLKKTEDYLGMFKGVLSDRLINRFDKFEVQEALKNMYMMLEPGGLLSFSVKLGLYPMDLKMIQNGIENGDIDIFFNSETKTMNFSKAERAIHDCLQPHGSISKDTLVQWYIHRGKEKRFIDIEIEELLSKTLFIKTQNISRSVSSDDVCIYKILKL